MKKLSIAVAVVSLSIATPVFACPGHDAVERTAEQPKDTQGKQTAKAADKAKDAKPAKDAKDAKPADKVSQK